MRRGEIWLVAYDDPARRGEPAKTRPGVIVSNDRLNASRALSVVTVPLTTTARSHPLHVEIDADELDDVSYAQVELVAVSSRDRLIARVGSVGVEAMAQIGARLRLLLDL